MKNDVKLLFLTFSDAVGSGHGRLDANGSESLVGGDVGCLFFGAHPVFCDGDCCYCDERVSGERSDERVSGERSDERNDDDRNDWC